MDETPLDVHRSHIEAFLYIRYLVQVNCKKNKSRFAESSLDSPICKMVLLAFAPLLLAFAPPAAVQTGCVASQRTCQAPAMMAKGFGKAPPPPPPKPPPSTKKVARDAAAADFDRLKETGAPEYMVAVRTIDSAGEASEWMPVGGIAVPRSNSEDMAVSLAIFNNEDELLRGAYQAYPKLKTSKDKFEYGFKLKEFMQEDPWKVASQEKTRQSDNPFMQWFNQLDSPLNKD